MEKLTKELEYSAKILAQISEIFHEDSENHISLDELQEDDNLERFIHALATMVPNHFYNKATGESKDNLQFNHIANQLCFQYCTKDEQTFID